MQVRNLSYLNRDLDKVLLITANADAHALQPDNAVKVCCATCPFHGPTSQSVHPRLQLARPFSSSWTCKMVRSSLELT